jgi:hypothetical protein
MKVLLITEMGLILHSNTKLPKLVRKEGGGIFGGSESIF